MAIDQAQHRFDERLRAAGPVARLRLHAEMHRDAFLLAWAQADRAGEMTEPERARYLLRRLYPDLEGERLDAIVRRLEMEWQAGTWTGLVRPAGAPQAMLSEAADPLGASAANR